MLFNWTGTIIRKAFLAIIILKGNHNCAEIICYIEKLLNISANNLAIPWIEFIKFTFNRCHNIANT